MNFIKANLCLLSIVTFFIFAVTGCYTSVLYQKELYSTLKLYNLNEGVKIIAEIDDIYNNNGEILGELENGEKFEGEFYIRGNPIHYHSPIHNEVKLMSFSKFLNKKVGNDTSERKYSEQYIKNTFPELYGFSRNSRAEPIGSGVILSENGLLIEIVFYRVDFNKRIGDGIGRDNKGNIYRIYISSEYI